MNLKPCYDFPQPNDSILIDKTKASVSAKGKVYKRDAEVRLELIPKAGIYVYASLDLPWLSFDDINEMSVTERNLPGFVKKIIPSFNGVKSKVDLVWCPRTEPIIGCGDQSTHIISVVFHLFNYEELFGTRRSIEHFGNSSHAIHHVDLKVAGWNIELKSMVTTSDTLKTLRETGGYGLTHIGCLKKEDGSSFDGNSAEKMLTALRFFLSFSKGMWCNPCLAVGFDDKEKKVWEAWSSPRGRWAEPSSWFDPHHCEQLVNLFPGFMSKWENKDWQEALREVIYWYLSSNCSTLGLGIGIDAGIILTQAAIERLSFEYVVRHKRLIEEGGFKDLRASDKFRMLFSSLDIPIDIPSSLPKLQKLAKQKQINWIDAPHAITEIRNSLVHPEHKRRDKISGAFLPAWNLGQWYLELALLRICEYSGTYGNRLIQRWVGNVEPVPWQK